MSKQDEMAASVGLTPAEMQASEDAAYAAAGAALAAGAELQDALQAASDAGIEFIQEVLRNRREQLTREN